MTPNAAGPYRVVCPRSLLDQLRDLAQRAVGIGIGDTIADEVRRIYRGLEEDPLSWGDPQFRLHNLDLLIFHRYCPTFYVRYGVDEENRVVYVTELRPRPGHPLERGS
jgi:hypothetical protein